MVDTFDFGGLEKPKAGAKLTNPRDIFRARPSGKSKIKELWQGQAKALDDWFAKPDRNTLISMYTGAGKTLVGCLIAQSLLNQGRRNVVYACPTIDLIRQTEKEANAIGLNTTTYFEQNFSNDGFDQGKSFCITTYQALLITRTKFRGQRRPGAIIFDDAHVGERLVRDVFTVRISKIDHKDLFVSLLPDIEEAFTEIGQKHNFDAVMADTSAGSVALCPPNGIYARSDRIQATLQRFAGSSFEIELPLDYLKGHIGCCAVTISKNIIEFTPAFLPSMNILALEDNAVPKVFLSATVQSRGDIIRAFGKSPFVIEPDVDAGRGERVLLFGSAIPSFVSDKQHINKLSQKHKVLISVPSERSSNNWAPIVTAPSDAKAFSAQLDQFRAANTGKFLLVGRYDGIDLPDDDCRIMVVDGLPIGTSQLERYSFDRLHLDQAFFARIANRITQLFGRINRGKNDYGVYIIASRDFENWIRNVSNQAFFPKILQEQVRLSEDFCDQIKASITDERVYSIIDQIIDRDPKWVEYYNAHIGLNPLDDKKIEQRDQYTKVDDQFAKREANFIVKLWQGDIQGAIAEFEEEFETIRSNNPRLAGWYSVWIGTAYNMLGNQSAMFDWFDEARNRLGGKLPLPRRQLDEIGTIHPEKTVIEEGLRRFCIGSLPEVMKRGLKAREQAKLAFGDTPHNIAEEAVRQIGANLGFDARRPCNDVHDGPDDLWLDHHTKIAIPIELKNEKKGTAINSEEVGEIFQHLEWTRTNYKGYSVPGILVYTESSSVTDSSNPSLDMFFTNRERLESLWDDFTQIVAQMAKTTPVERYAIASQVGESDKWTSEAIFNRLALKSLKQVN
ncbi:DEAD/DEAH box helicase family protein [Mesorhizobium erdmanii]|uniref:Helicase ATP-binding domain-containing protein n=1 Tax=Mesorhizobium erdmanii TaxID=1777866 RepID=A0A6M7UFH3_9HYPH|nr:MULTISPECIES: DEAD/DEAH box helicase family protein [Mesorhizobium]OBQ63294.1 hypothetical protein A8146_12505 [Mesorhizobium loti]QKC74848.1 hypothetical protein EB233_04220 [Mesorhizobium erdmanii]